VITQLGIEGFKSFGSPAPPLKLCPLNVVVGANASGKSNLLNALKFLQYAVKQNVDYAVNEFGGVSEVRNKILRQREKKKPVRIYLRLEKEHKATMNGQQWGVTSFDYDIRFDLRSDDASPTIESETLTADMYLKGQRQQFKLSRDASNVRIIDPTRPKEKESEQSYQVPTQEKNRLALGVGFFALPCAMLRYEIEGWRFFNISPDIARQPYKESIDLSLGPAGENLAVVLHQIQKRKNDLNAIVSGLKGAVPGFKNFKTARLPVEGKLAFQIIEEGIRGPIIPSSVSDGTIRLLALLVITVWTRERSTLIAIEEPENGIHPHLSEYIIEILRMASKDVQLLVTTHNPDLLDYLEPEEVFLCDKVHGFTKIRTASDVEDIHVFQKHFKLGELWVQGTLGGIL
jgi:predicted ATPase